MEEKQKGKILFVSEILGICGLVLWSLLSFIPLMTRTDSGVNDSLFTAFPGMVIIVVGSLIAAIVLNIFGRVKNDAKKTFFAGFLYIISLTIPSAVICFANFAKMKKQIRLLFESGILGICGLVLWTILFFGNLFGGDSSFTLFILQGVPVAINAIGSLPFKDIIIMWAIIIYIMLAFISLIIAIVLNFIGWKKNDTKKVLFSAILYIISLTIPSSIICFIDFVKNKKGEKNNK